MVQYILVLDTETTIDERQKLAFGAFRYACVSGEKISTLAEGLIYDDELPATDPTGYQQLLNYAENHSAEIDWHFRDREPNPQIELLSRSAFNRRWLWHCGFKHRELIVGFNLPFDLSRLAVAVGDSRGNYKEGFSLAMFQNTTGEINNFRPRLRVKVLNSKASFISYTKKNKIPHFAGRFLDLRTLAFALTNVSHSLDSACDAFNVEHGKTHAVQHGVIDESYIDYCRRDVLATTELYAALMQEYDTHDLDKQPEKVYSPASIAKGYLEKMRIPKPLDTHDIPPEIYGYAMSAYYGARAECRIRRQPMPVAQVDFTSMYPSVNTLLGLWKVLTAKSITIRHNPIEMQELLEMVTLETCFDPATWQRFSAYVKIKPRGEILPVRARYNKKTWNIGVNHLIADEEYWFAVPDLVASVILTGKVPTVLDSITVEAVGTAPNLQAVSLRGSVPVDPSTDDFFRLIIEERARNKGTKTAAFLKVLANSGCYGIFGELNTPGRSPGPAEAYANKPLGVHRRPEVPGPYCFPLIASVITASARLMLAMLERSVTDAGGQYVCVDTDSMAIVCSEQPGDIHGVGALHPNTVDAIREKFNRLNPYRDGVQDLLKLEYRGWCYAVSAKRYALYHVTERQQVVIDKPLEHGLGHLLNPTDPDSEDRRWIEQLWQYIIAKELGLDAIEPNWLDRPAISRYTVTQPSLLHTFDAINNGRDYADQVKPSNFILIAHALRMQVTQWGPVVPIASYEPDPRKWTSIRWRNKRNPRDTFRISALTFDTVIDEGVVYVQSYRDVLESHRTHAEEKFAQADGLPCGPGYRGVLHRRWIRATGTVVFGSESRRMEEVQLGLENANSVTPQRTVDDWERTHTLVMSVLGRYSLNKLHSMTGIARSTLGYIRAGRKPWQGFIDELVRLACTVAADELGKKYVPGNDPTALLTEWRDKQEKANEDTAKIETTSAPIN